MANDPKNLSEAVTAAKEAVRDLEEPLRTEAFKIILDKLISGTGKVTPDKKRKRKAPAPSQAGVSKRGPSRKTITAGLPSSLKLGVDDLRKLKSYCERFDLSGTEQIAFVLANFLREHTDLEAIGTADIGYCYRQLVSQKVKVLAVNNAADWTRALNWLTAPSRKKEWLEKQGDGYVVSNAGLLRFNELEAQVKPKQVG